MADDLEVDQVEEPEEEEPEVQICRHCGLGPVIQVRGAFVVLGYEHNNQVSLVYHHLPRSMDPDAYVVVCRDICMSCGQISTYIAEEELGLFRDMVRFLDEGS